MEKYTLVLCKLSSFKSFAHAKLFKELGRRPDTFVKRLSVESSSDDDAIVQAEVMFNQASSEWKSAWLLVPGHRMTRDEKTKLKEFSRQENTTQN